MRKIFYKTIIFLTIFLFLVPIFCFSAGAQSAQEYAPIFYFESDEELYPVSVEYLYETVELKNITLSINNEDTIIDYYDNTIGTINDDNVINDYTSKFEDNDPIVYPTVYYYINNSEDTTFIQYWMFYIFNDGEHNRHEGDWEMVQVVIPSSQEKWVAYSQHYSGQKASWDLVDKQGSNIKVYVARGSHANYLRPYSGKLGISSDIVADNGLVLEPSDYNLINLEGQTWLDFQGLWGEISSEEDLVTGQAGPQGPKYRVDMMGNTMWNGLSWGSGLLEATGYLFMIEWFLYNFVTILIAITVLALIISFLLIYRKHKKYGLGPRIVSIFYIDGLNLHTIANILFFVALIIAILGLFNNWYTVSADIDTEVFQTQEMLDIIRLDGINGMNIYMPSQYGSIPMGSAVFPFAYIFLIGFIFMFISTVGIYKSTKLGRKYILKGIRFILIVVVLIISLMLIGNLVGSGPSEGSTSGIGGLFKEISSNPIGGTYTIPASEYGLESGSIAFQWNLGFGMTLILISGIIFLVAGILNIVDGKEFFKPKIPKGKKITETPKPQPQKQEIEQKQEKEVKQEKPKNEESKKVKEQFCPSCGTKLKENTNFCHECGGKV